MLPLWPSYFHSFFVIACTLSGEHLLALNEGCGATKLLGISYSCAAYFSAECAMHTYLCAQPGK